MPWEIPITIEDTTYPVRFNTDSEPTQTDIDEAVSYLLQQRSAPAQLEPDQPGRLGSFASSVGRGALSVVPGTLGGIGYLTGQEGLVETAEDIEGGINRMLPVNPAYENEFLMKAGDALGQAGGMLLTGGVTGAAGKALAASRGLQTAQAAAKGTQLARNVLTGTGVLQGARGGGQAAEQYGMQGGTAYARALLGGAIEGLSERALFGMGTELAPVKKFLGDAAEKGVGGIAKAAGTEAGEEAAAQIGGNLATSVLAPYGVQTPGALEGAGEAALLGGIAGGALGGVNALMQPSPTIEGEAMAVEQPAPTPEAPPQPEADEFGVEAFRQEMAQIAQTPDPIEPLKQVTAQAAEASVMQNADVLPATAAVIEAGGLAPTPVQEETPVGAPVEEQPASGVLLPQITREEEIAQVRARLRQRLSDEERAAMEQRLAQAEDEGILSDVFAAEREKAAAREDFLRRQQDLEAERQRLEDEGILGDVFAEERQRATAREQQQPKAAETPAPVQPIPAVEEAVEVEADNIGEEADKIKRQDIQKAQSKFLQFRGKSVGTGLTHMIKFPDGRVRKVTPFEWDRLNAPDETPEATVGLINENKLKKLNRHQSEQYGRYRFEAKRRGFTPSNNQVGETLDLLKKLNPPEGVTVYLRRLGRLDLLEPEQPVPTVEEAVAPTQRVIAEEDKADFAELQDLMSRRGQVQNKVKGVSFSKKDEARFQELGARLDRYFFEQVDPVNDPVVGEDINNQPIRQSQQGTYYTVENGRVRTGPAFKLDPEYVRQQNEILRQERATEEAPAAAPNDFNEEAALLNDLQIAEADYQAAEQKARAADDLFFTERDKYDTRKNKPRNYTYAGPKEHQDRILALANEAFKARRFANDVAQDLGKARKNALKKPETTPEQVQNVENVIDDTGAVEVGLGMENLPAGTEIEFEGEEFRVVGYEDDGRLVVSNSSGGWKDIPAGSKVKVLPAINNPYASLVSDVESGFAFLDRLKLNDAPKSAPTIPSGVLPRGTRYFRTDFRGTGQAGPSSYAITPDGLLYEDIGRSMTHGGVSPFRLLGKITQPTTPPADATLQREIPENRVQERQAPDEGGTTPESGGRNIAEKGGTVSGEIVKKSRALPTFTPPPKEPFKPSAERFAQFYIDDGFPEATAAKNGAKLMQAVETGEWTDLLHPDNKKSRAIWETWTRQKLPKGLAASKEAVAEFTAEYRAKTFTTPAAELSDKELDAEILRIAEQGMKPTASQTLKDRALELSKEFQARRETAKTQQEDSIINTRRAAIARKALAFTGGRGTVGNLAGDSFAQMRADLLSEIEGEKVPKAKAGINALMKALYREFGIPTDTEAGMQKKLAQALQDAVTEATPPSKPAAEVETPVAGVPAKQKGGRKQGASVGRSQMRLPQEANTSAETATPQTTVKLSFPTLEEHAAAMGMPSAADPEAYNHGLIVASYKQAYPDAADPDIEPADFGSTNTVVTKETKDKAAKSLRKKLGGQTNVGLDPSILKDAVTIGAFYIEGGARSFADFSAKMIEEFGAGIQKYLRPAYEALRKRTDIDTTGMDPEEGGEPAAKVEEPEASPPAPEPKAEEPKAAAPAETEEPAAVAIANDPVDVQREALGLPPIMRQTQEAYTFPQMWSDAEAAMAANPKRGEALVTELNDTPRTISALEDAILLRERVNRVNALDLAMVEFNKAPKGNNEMQRRAMDDAITALTQLDDALNVAGTEQGRSLNARKMLAKLDYTLPKMLTTLRAANEGDLSEADVAMVTRLQKQLAETQKKLAEAEKRQSEFSQERFDEVAAAAKEEGRKEALREIEEKAQVQAAKVAELTKRKAEFQEAKKKPSVLDEILKAAEARIASRRGKLYSDVLMLNAAADAADYVLIGAVKIAKGITKFTDWVASMKESDLSLADDQMEQLFKDSKAFHDGEVQAEETLLKTRKAKAPVIDKIKTIAADGEELDSRTIYNFVVEKVKERSAKTPKAEMTDKDLASVIQEVTKDVQQYFPNITEREIRDLFSGYGKILMPSQDELSKQVRQLSALGKLVSAIEDAKAQRAPLKSGPQRDKATQAIRLKQKELARALRMNGVEYAADEEQLRSPLDAIKARLNNQINDLALEINTRKKTPRRPSVDYDKETEELVKLRDELKSISDFVNAPAGPTFAELVDEEMKKLDKRIAELQKTLDDKQFIRVNDTTLYTQELQTKRDERDRLSKLVSKARKQAVGDVRTQDEIDRAAIKDARDAIAELERKIKEKDFTRPERRTPTETAEYKALTEEKERLQKILRDERLKAEGRQGPTDEQRIKQATAAIDKSMERIQKMLDSGNYDAPKRVSKTPETPELKSKREARDLLRKQLEELRKAKRDAEIDPIAKQIATDKKRIQTRMDKLKKRMADGDFSKPAKRQKAVDKELLDLQVKEEKLKEEWAKMVFERQLASRGPGKKILDTVQQALNTSRAILTSVDVSAVLRQGGFIVLGNPLRGLKNLGPMFQAFGSEEFARQDKFRLENRENFKNGLYQQSKLFLSDTGKVNQMNKQEEAFMTRWLEKIPKGIKGAYIGSVLRGSQRAYTVFLNRLRADSFDAMVGNLKKGAEPTPEESKAVADYINIATGRGDLWKATQAATFLNTVFFAPRLVASRFQILAGYPYFTASGRTKALVLREYAKFLTGASVVYALGMLAQGEDDEPIETDPRSSDFAKIRFGDTRVDPLGGLIQATVFVSRVIAGEKKTAKGEIVPLRPEFRFMNLFRETPRTDKVKFGGDVTSDVAKKFLQSKLSPIVGSVVNVLDMRTVVGEDADPMTEAERMVVPMSFTEMKETFEAQGVPEGTALTILQLFGMGVQTYTPGKK